MTVGGLQNSLDNLHTVHIIYDVIQDVLLPSFADNAALFRKFYKKKTCFLFIQAILYELIMLKGMCSNKWLLQPSSYTRYELCY